MLKVPARVEPHQLCEDDALRPDIQLDLPDYTLLGDVTVNHPNALSWRKKAAKRGVAAVGDERAKQKDDKYAAMAKVGRRRVLGVRAVYVWRLPQLRPVVHR